MTGARWLPDEVVVAAAAVVAGYLLGANMPARMALLAAAVGLAMTVVGAATLARFLRANPLPGAGR